MRRPFFAAALVAALAVGGLTDLAGDGNVALAQAPPASHPVETLPDVARLTPAEVAFVHPLARALDEAPKLAERVNPPDFDSRQPLLFTVHLLETGKVVEAFAVEPGLKAFAVPLAALVPRWRFTPAKKGGQPVSTWVTYGIELAVSLEKGIFTAFSLEPVRREDPLVPPVPDTTGDAWFARYPREIDPRDASVVSIEDVEVLPTPEKTPWSLDPSRARAHVTALVEVTEQGTIGRFLPTGDTEPLLGVWLKPFVAKWRLTPPMSSGRPVACWMTLDATLDYTLNSAKKKSERIVKKNLRATPK